MRTSFHKLLLASVLLCLSLSLLTACSSAPPQPPLAVTLHAQDIKFDLTTIAAKVNQPVTLTYINQGSIDHAFAIPDLVEEQKIRPGQTAVFTFTPKQAGEFKFVCAMPGHEMAGMVGTLIVTQ
jgi:uncharacterized cupredoxin-like copper-binding protein